MFTIVDITLIIFTIFLLIFIIGILSSKNKNASFEISSIINQNEPSKFLLIILLKRLDNYYEKGKWILSTAFFIFLLFLLFIILNYLYYEKLTIFPNSNLSNKIQLLSSLILFLLFILSIVYSIKLIQGTKDLPHFQNDFSLINRYWEQKLYEMDREQFKNISIFTIKRLQYIENKFSVCTISISSLITLFITLVIIWFHNIL
ncbi:MAG: hypothetical protein OEZ22_13810 [Spirochaetia bacterium]|nr:hypothetical protein [Spirochaetia bacterium]